MVYYAVLAQNEAVCVNFTVSAACQNYVINNLQEGMFSKDVQSRTFSFIKHFLLIDYNTVAIFI